MTGTKKIRPVIMRVKRKGPTTPCLFLASFKRGISVFATGWMDLCDTLHRLMMFKSFQRGFIIIVS